MTIKKQPSLEDVNAQFTIWRNTRQHKTSPIPDKLWEVAVALTSRHSLHKISSTLRVNHTALRDQKVLRIMSNSMPCPEHAGFIELPHIQTPSQSECLIEMENKHGEKMRMHFTGKVSLDLMVLTKNFWARRS